MPGSFRRRPGPASARLRRLLLSCLTGFALLTCAPPEAPVTGPAPSTGVAGPEVRIGILTGVPRLTVQGDSGLTLRDADGAVTGAAGPGESLSVRPGSGGLIVTGQAGALDQPVWVRVEPGPGGQVVVNGRAYRGRLTVAGSRAGLTVVNTVGLEEYLVGVVAAEMGRRDAAELEALAAQAIISRTFAVRNLGKRADQGFDLLASVADQAYSGSAVEYQLARDAVQRTAGLILTWQGAPIDGFFFSTCAGRTAKGTEVYAGAERSYLRSIADTDDRGQPYCRISPRYQWREQWTAAELRAVLRQALPGPGGVTAEQAATADGVEIVERTGSNRVARLRFQLAGRSAEVVGPDVRRTLHPVSEPLLRSALFHLSETREGGRLVRLVAEGQGAGHGVGFCQWGAVGRARAGEDAASILRAYFPGTTLTRAY